MVVARRPSYRIDCHTIKGGSRCVAWSYHPCIIFIGSCLVFSLWDLELMVIFLTSSSSSKTEFTCFFYCIFGVAGFTGIIRGRVLTILLWAFSNLLVIVISIKIMLALVASFPTNLVSLNSESVCRSCVSFGVLKKVAVVLPLMGAVLPLGGDVIFYYRGYFRGYFRSGPKNSSQVKRW